MFDSWEVQVLYLILAISLGKTSISGGILTERVENARIITPKKKYSLLSYLR
jgi:hypothetical protein